MGNHELSPEMLYASHLFTRLHGLKNTLLAGSYPSCRKVMQCSECSVGSIFYAVACCDDSVHYPLRIWL